MSSDPVTPNAAADAPSPVAVAARLNQFTPRDSLPVGTPAGGAGEASAADEERDGVPAAPRSFRESVRAREGTAALLVFRVGAELFAFPLDQVEEAVEIDTVHPVPEAAGATLGVVELRGRMVPIVSPAPALGVAPAGLAAMLVLRDGGRRVGVAVDDVDDVLTADLTAVGPLPGGEVGDAVLLAIVRRGADLVAVADPDALLAACLAESRIPETAV